MPVTARSVFESDMEMTGIVVMKGELG